MLRITSALILLSTLSTANAQQYGSNNNPLRVWGASTGIVMQFEGPTGEVEMRGGWLETGFSYQFNDTIFAELNYAKNRVDSYEINGQTTDADEAWTSKRVGIGFRSARANSMNKYFGAAYYKYLGSDDSGDDAGTISLFMETDNNSRYGRLGLSRATKNATSTTLGGRHVWFLQSGLGLGFDWSYESGEEEAVKRTGITGGLLLMFRL